MQNTEDKNLEISKIKLPNGSTFNIKDEELRKQIEQFLGKDYVKDRE